MPSLFLPHVFFIIMILYQLRSLIALQMHVPRYSLQPTFVSVSVYKLHLAACQREREWLCCWGLRYGCIMAVRLRSGCVCWVNHERREYSMSIAMAAVPFRERRNVFAVPMTPWVFPLSCSYLAYLWAQWRVYTVRYSKIVVSQQDRRETGIYPHWDNLAPAKVNWSF